MEEIVEQKQPKKNLKGKESFTTSMTRNLGAMTKI